jgi:putative flavoprotein involved in K+ transport
VSAVRPRAGDGLTLETSEGPLDAETVVLATGAYQRPHRPPAAATLPADLLQIDVEDFRSPAALPAGPVLVVGSGQSGCQIAEELHQAGREVFLACGRAPWFPRRLGDRDLSWWVLETGFLDAPFSALPSPAARLAANVQATGAGGGHDLHYRTLRKLGVTLLGHFLGADGRRARFAPDLGESVAWGDERNAQLMELVRKLVVERGLPSPEIPEPEPFSGEAPEELDLHGFGAVVFAGGFRPDYESWVSLPGAFDELGFPIHEEGASTVAPGLYFVGVHFLRKRKSALLNGVGEDAAIVARQITRRQVSAT